jgi:hypothetical protein
LQVGCCEFLAAPPVNGATDKEEVRLTDGLGCVRQNSQERGVRCEVLGVRSEVSGVRCEVAGMRSEVSGVRCEVAGMRCEVCRIMKSRYRGAERQTIVAKMKEKRCEYRCVPVFADSVSAVNRGLKNVEN